MNQALDSISIALSQSAADAIVSELPEDARAFVRDHSYPLMVKNLAKPGEVIRNELSLDKFITLMRTCASVVTNSSALDRVKKQTVYNKPEDKLPQVNVYALGSSQGLAQAFENLTPEQAHLLHMAIGWAGEAGEMLEAILNHILNGTPLDVPNVIEEAGDGLFYQVGILNGIRVSLLECSIHNKVKLLGKRYKDGYSDAAAQARADKPAGE